MLTIEGKRTSKSESGNEYESTSFQRRLTVPESVNLDTLRAKFNPGGRLIVRGAKIVEDGDENKKREKEKAGR